MALVFTTLVAGKLVVNASIHPPTGGWVPPVVLSDTDARPRPPRMSQWAPALSTAVWVEGTQAASKPMVNTRTLGAAGTWGTPITFVDAGVSGADVAASDPPARW